MVALLFGCGALPPASGYRAQSAGTLAAMGSNAYFWHSATNSISSYYLRYYNSDASPAYGSSNRAAGFPVRCVQHLRQGAAAKLIELRVDS